MSYLTDGFHLYEVVDVVRNFGRSGDFLLVLNSLTGERRSLDDLEQAICSAVTR